MDEALFDVGDMHCSSCVRHITSALEEVDGVKQVDVRMREGTVLVRHAGAVQPGELIAAIAKAGYPARLRPRG